MMRPRYASSLPTSRRRFRVVFETLEAFRREFRTNLGLGGLFIPCSEPIELLEQVDVELELAFRGARFELLAEVVSLVPPELARAGGTPGVAVQLLESPADLRRRFEPILGEVAEPDPQRVPGDRRKAPRRPARVTARLAGAEGPMAARTRDLSHSGVLVSVEGGVPVPVGQSVRLALIHPTSREELEVRGTVARHIESDGSVPALAVHFDAADAARPEVVAFVDSLQSVEHARSLTGISGAIEAISLANLLQSFASCAPCGTLSVACGAEEGRIVFERDQLLLARAGPVTGVKALARMFAWISGSFEFQGRVDDVDREELPVPLDAAILEAVQQSDEIERVGELPVLHDDRVVVDGAKLGTEHGALSQTEETVVELAQAGLTVRGILDVVPESDAGVLSAMRALFDKGVLRPEA